MRQDVHSQEIGKHCHAAWSRRRHSRRAAPSRRRLASPLSVSAACSPPATRCTACRRPARRRRRFRRGASGRSPSSASPCSRPRCRTPTPAANALRAAGCSAPPGWAPGWSGCGSSPRPATSLATALFALFHGVAALVAPRGPWRVVGRPAAHTLAEALRFCFPFGGVPAGQPRHRPGGRPVPRRRPRRRRAAAHLVHVPDRLRAGRPVAVRPGTGPQARRHRQGRVARRHRVPRRARRVGASARSPTAPSADVNDAAAARRRRCRVAGRRARTPWTPTRRRGVRPAPGRHRHHRAGSVDLVRVARERHRRRRRSTAAPNCRASPTKRPASARRSPWASPRTPPTASTSSTRRSSSPPTARSSTATTRCAACRSASTCRCAACCTRLGAPTDLVPRDAVAGTGPAVLTLPDGTTMARRHLVGGVLRRPRERRRRPRRRVHHQPHQRQQLHVDGAAEPADRVVAAAGRRAGPLGGAGRRPPASARSSRPTATCHPAHLGQRAGGHQRHDHRAARRPHVVLAHRQPAVGAC